MVTFNDEAKPKIIKRLLAIHVKEKQLKVMENEATIKANHRQE